MNYRLLYVLLIATCTAGNLAAQTTDLYSYRKVGFTENTDPRGVQSIDSPYRTEINGLQVDFTTKGLKYSVYGLQRTKKEEYEEGELPDEGPRKIITLDESFSVLFVNPSDSMSVEAAGRKSNYVIQHNKIKQACFDQITYRNVWPNIHIEFTIPEQGGIKYDIHLDPGAVVDHIQLDYSAAEELTLIDGDLQVSSPLGKWIEHAPVSFASGQSVESAYKLNNGILSFNLKDNEIAVPTVIDPWIELIPAITSYEDLADPADSLWNSPFGDPLYGTGLDNAYNRVQIDYDTEGNIYLSQIPCLFYESSSEFGFDDFYAVGRFVHKYNSEGELLFTLDLDNEFAICTDISVDKTNQNFYSSRLFSDLLYMAPDGTLTDSFIIDDLPENIDELISLKYDHCQDKMILGLGADNEELGSFIATTGSDFTGELDYSFAYDISESAPNALPFNDNIDVIIDPYTGDYFMLFLLRTQTGFFEDRALLRTDPVNINQVWQTNGEFLYLIELAMHSVGIIQSNLGRMHFEALAVGSNSVYGTNGSQLVQWDKNDGSQLNEFELSAFQQNLGRSEGIAVDMCGNLYVGGNNEIRVFDENLNQLLDIPLAGMPQDIEVFGNKIYVAEDFNIESIDIPESLTPWQFTQTPDSCGQCLGGADITFCGETELISDITVEWQANGDNNFSTTGLCAGWNQIKIFENKGCYINEYLDSVFVDQIDPELCSISVNVDDQTLCEGECITISADVSGTVLEPISYEWSTGLEGNESEIELCPTSTTSYSVSVEDSNGEVSFDEFTLTVITLPDVNLGPDTSLCVGDQLTLDAGNPDASFSWQDGSTNQTLLVNTAGEYSVDVTINGCLSSDDISVDFDALSIDLGNDTTVCDLNGILLDAGDDALEYLWQDGTTSQFYSPLTAGTFYVTASIEGCISADTISIATSEVQASFSYVDTVLCEIAPVEFTDQSVSSTNSLNTWSWDFGDGSSSGAQDPSRLYQFAGDYTVTLSVTDNFGCEDSYTETVQVEVFPSPEAFFSVTPATPVTFENVEFTDESIGAISWNWDLGDGTTSINQNTTHFYETPGLYPIELVVENEFCSDKFEVILRVGEELIIHVPNSFTPNEDGINDLFGPVISGGDIADFEMLIFNRWGELVFETTDISKRWNGARLGSRSTAASEYYVPNGVYAWQITVKENLSTEKREIFGTLTLIR